MTIHKYAKNGDLESLKQYTAFNVFDDIDLTPLAWAVYKGHDVCVEYMLDNGANIELLVEDHIHVICFALWGNHPKCFCLLLERITDFNLCVPGCSCLLELILEDNLFECLKILLSYKPTLQRSKSRTVFHYVEHSRNLQLVLEYAQHTNQLDDIDQGDLLFGTPLINAVRGGYYDSVNLLLTYGADPDLTDCDGQTARIVAEHMSDRMMIDLINSYDISIKGALEHYI